MMMRVPLYQLSAQHGALLEAMEGDDDAAADAAFHELAATNMELGERMTGLVAMLDAMRADADYIRDEEKRLAERRRALQAKTDRIREHAVQCMELSGMKRLRTKTHTIALIEGAESVEVEDVAQVPDEHVRLERIASKTSIMAEYKRTGIVPAGARIRPGTRYLKIT
jgi:hypothetical protein